MQDKRQELRLRNLGIQELKIERTSSSRERSPDKKRRGQERKTEVKSKKQESPQSLAKRGKTAKDTKKKVRNWTHSICL